MANNMDETLKSIPSKFHKDIPLLKDSASKAKNTLVKDLQRREKICQDSLEKLQPEAQLNHMPVYLKQINKIKSNLQVLNGLSDIDIVTFALTCKKDLKTLQCNGRAEKSLRLKAKVANLKPLSTDLAIVKRSRADNVLDKATLNIQIVAMRSIVKQAKVHIINKLVRLVRKLSKGDDDKKAKYQKKVNKIVKRIKYINELEPDDVSKFALSTTDNLHKIISDVNMPMKQNAKATIALHRFVAKPVDDFKNRFPNWQKEVPSLLNKKKNKSKLKKKIEVGASDTEDEGESENEISAEEGTEGDESEIEEDSSQERTSDEEEVNNEDSDEETGEMSDVGKESDEEGRCNENEESEIEEESCQEGTSEEEDSNEEGTSDENEMFVGTGENNEVDEGSDEEDESEKSETEGESDSEEDNDEEKESNDDDSSGDNEENQSEEELNESYKNEVDIKEKTNNAKGGKIHQNKLQNKTDLVSRKRVKDLPKIPPKKKKIVEDQTKKVPKKITNINNINKQLKTLKKDSKKPKVVKNVPKVVDPFFMTKNNEEYVTSQVPVDDTRPNWKSKTNDFNKTKSKTFNTFIGKSKWSSEENNRKGNKFNESKLFPNRPTIQKDATNTSKPLIDFRNRKERRQALRPPLEKPVEKLHPSWEAKKKQPSITTFQGKKVIFD